jgi:hypothetical protein
MSSFLCQIQTFMASDGTTHAEMFCFDSIAKAISGKSCSSIIASTTNTIAIPPEIAAIISLKFTFAVIFNQRSFSSQNKVLLIKSIVATHEREHLLPHTEQIFRLCTLQHQLNLQVFQHNKDHLPSQCQNSQLMPQQA